MRLLRHIFGLQRLGFIVVFALLVQILAPIGGVWAATARAADPLATIQICSGLHPDQGGSVDTYPTDHSACCPLCTVAQPLALLANLPTGLVTRISGEVTWVQFGQRAVAAQARDGHQARAPPFIV